MQTLYNTPDDFAAYMSQQSSQRLVAIVSMASSAIFFAGRSLILGPDAPSSPIDRLTPDDLFHLTKSSGLKDLESVESIVLSMDWMARQDEGSSKRLYSTLRNEWEEMGLWTIERQSPRQGRQQKATRLFGIDFKAIFNIARAAIVRLIETHELGDQPCFMLLFPSHEFGFFNGWFHQIFGYFLKSSEEGRTRGLSITMERIMKRLPTIEEIENYARRLMGLDPIVPIAEKKTPTKPENWGVLSDDPRFDDLPY